MTQAVCKYDCTHTISSPILYGPAESFSVCVGDGLYMYVEVFQASVSIRLRMYSPSGVNIYMHNDPEVCNKKNKQLLFAHIRWIVLPCTCVCVYVCAQNPIIPQCVLSAAS